MRSECEFHEGEDAIDCRACEKLHEEFCAWVRVWVREAVAAIDGLVGEK